MDNGHESNWRWTSSLLHMDTFPPIYNTTLASSNFNLAVSFAASFLLQVDVMYFVKIVLHF